MLTCSQVMQMLRAYMNGELELPDAVEVRVHLEQCRSCPRVQKICGVFVLQEKSTAGQRYSAA